MARACLTARGYVVILSPGASALDARCSFQITSSRPLGANSYFRLRGYAFAFTSLPTSPSPCEDFFRGAGSIRRKDVHGGKSPVNPLISVQHAGRGVQEKPAAQGSNAHRARMAFSNSPVNAPVSRGSGGPHRTVYGPGNS